MPQSISRSIRQGALALLVAASVLAGPGSLADDEGHARAPRELASIDEALAAVQRSHPGRVLKVELEHTDDGPAAWIYEVKVLTGAGHVLEIKVDAVNLELVGVEGGRARRRDDD